MVGVVGSNPIAPTKVSNFGCAYQSFQLWVRLPKFLILGALTKYSKPLRVNLSGFCISALRSLLRYA